MLFRPTRKMRAVLASLAIACALAATPAGFAAVSGAPQATPSPERRLVLLQQQLNNSANDPVAYAKIQKQIALLRQQLGLAALPTATAAPKPGTAAAAAKKGSAKPGATNKAGDSQEQNDIEALNAERKKAQDSLADADTTANTQRATPKPSSTTQRQPSTPGNVAAAQQQNAPDATQQNAAGKSQPEAPRATPPADAELLGRANGLSSQLRAQAQAARDKGLDGVASSLEGAAVRLDNAKRGTNRDSLSEAIGSAQALLETGRQEVRRVAAQPTASPVSVTSSGNNGSNGNSGSSSNNGNSSGAGSSSSGSSGSSGGGSNPSTPSKRSGNLPSNSDGSSGGTNPDPSLLEQLAARNANGATNGNPGVNESRPKDNPSGNEGKADQANAPKETEAPKTGGNGSNSPGGTAAPKTSAEAAKPTPNPSGKPQGSQSASASPGPKTEFEDKPESIKLADAATADSQTKEIRVRTQKGQAQGTQMLRNCISKYILNHPAASPIGQADSTSPSATPSTPNIPFQKDVVTRIHGIDVTVNEKESSCTIAGATLSVSAKSSDLPKSEACEGAAFAKAKETIDASTNTAKNNGADNPNPGVPPTLTGPNLQAVDPTANPKLVAGATSTDPDGKFAVVGTSPGTGPGSAGAAKGVGPGN